MRRMKISRLWTLFQLAIIVLIGSALLAASGADASDERWKDALSKARQEGRVVLATSVGLPKYRQSIVNAISRRFGINLEVRVFGSGAELDAVVSRECAAGRQTIDVVQTGSGAPLHLYPKKCVAQIGPRLILPEVVDAKNWRGGRLKWLDPESRYLLQTAEAAYGWIVINKDQIRSNEITSAKDLLRPEYAGKIASYDLRRPGSAQGFAAYLMTLFGEEYIRKLFVEQKVTFSSDHRQVAEWAARGVHPIALGLVERAVEPFRQQNLPVEVIKLVDAPGYLTGGNSVIAAVNGAPQFNAATVFVNWFASKEGQETLSSSVLQPSRRADVHVEAVPGYTIPQEGLKYLDTYDYDFIVHERQRVTKRFMEIIGR